MLLTSHNPKYKWHPLAWKMHSFPSLFIQIIKMISVYLYSIQMHMDLQWGFLLRSKSHSSAVYMDDSYLKVNKYESCFNVFDTIKSLKELDFVIHKISKSVLTPSQEIAFMNYKIMILTLTDKNQLKINTFLTNCLKHNYISLQELARTISHIFATFLDVTYGPLHYRHLQRNKILGI